MVGPFVGIRAVTFAAMLGRPVNASDIEGLKLVGAQTHFGSVSDCRLAGGGTPSGGEGDFRFPLPEGMCCSRG